MIFDCYTEIYPIEKEVKTLCRPGSGADTCVWLVVGGRGFECVCHNRPHILVDRWMEGKTVAKRDGCERVNNFSAFGTEGGEIDVP